jgi:phosphoglycerate dehydrogenase-like enzyme
MRVLISDYASSMMPSHDLEEQTLRGGLGEDVEIEVFEYRDDAREEFLEHLAEADALLTAFVQIDAEAIEHASHLRVIAINATGFDNVDMDAATAHGIGVCPVGEYCTWDVSESAIAYIFALNKQLKAYDQAVQLRHEWDFAGQPQTPRLQEQTLGIFGFGKIGRCTAGKASGVVGHVMAYDPYVPDELFAELEVERAAEPAYIFERADLIVNHMALTEGNHSFFDKAAFDAMQRRPIFVNLARGLSVDESAVVEALDSGQIRAFGADVLSEERPHLEGNPLLGRDNVIITPHSAFYSTSSMRDLQVIPCQNIAHFLKGERDQLFKLVNDVPVVDRTK